MQVYPDSWPYQLDEGYGSRGGSKEQCCGDRSIARRVNGTIFNGSEQSIRRLNSKCSLCSGRPRCRSSYAHKRRSRRRRQCLCQSIAVGWLGKCSERDERSECAGFSPGTLNLRAARWFGRSRQWISGNQYEHSALTGVRLALL